MPPSSSPPPARPSPPDSLPDDGPEPSSEPEGAVNLSARELLSLSRPRFWMYLIGPYAVGLLIGARSPGDLWSWRALGFGLLFLFPANLFVYGVNDAHDFETDARNAKKQGYEARLQRSHQGRLLALCFGCCAPFVLLALLAAPARAWAPLGLFFVLAHQYSAPPVRAKARPFVDSLFNGLYVCPALFAYALLGARGVSWPWVGAAWCWTGAMHAYSAVPDIQADRQAGVPTVATALGLRSTLLGCAALYALSALLSLSALGWLSPLLGAVYLAMMALSLRAGATRGEAGVMEMYRFFPALNTLAGFLLFWRVAWIKFEPAILAALPALRPR